MPRANRTLQVANPIDQVWKVLGDFQSVHRYHPMVARVDKLSDHDRGDGAVRRCHFEDGTSVVETVIDWQDGTRYTVQLSEFSMPLAAATATLQVRAIDDQNSEVSIEMNFTPKFGPVGWVMGQVMMRPMMKRMFGRVLAGLAHHVETGEPVGQKGAPAVGTG